MGNENQGQSIEITDINDLLLDLINILQPKIYSLAFQRVLKCIFNLIVEKNVKLSIAIFGKLISSIIASSDSNCQLKHCQLTANILACVQLHVTKFPSDESKLLLYQLWSFSVNDYHPIAAQVLVTLFDEFVVYFHPRGPFLKVIQKLIQSKEKKERQSAYFLMHKLNEIFDSNVAAELKCSQQQWSDYIAVLEQLEEQQMKLDLSSLLENLKSAKDFLPWMRILLLKLFQTEERLVVFDTLKYICANLKLSHLTDWNLLEEFLAATNKTQLYNIDDIELFKNFVSISEVESFIQSVVNVPWQWQSVPLLEWLKCMPQEGQGQHPIYNILDKKWLFGIGNRLKELKNRCFQLQARNILFSRFIETIDCLSLGDYLILIEILYARIPGGYFDDFRLILKIVECHNFEKEIIHFNKVRLAIIFDTEIGPYFAPVLLDKLRDLPKTRHGWLRFFLITEIKANQQVRDFYTEEYGVHTSLIFHGKNLKKLQQHLVNKLMCETNEEKAFALEISVDLFVQNQIKEWNEIEELHLKPQGLLQQGGKITFKHLGELLSNCNTRFQDKNVLPAFVNALKKFPLASGATFIGEYASKHLNAKEQERLSLKIISDHVNRNVEVVYGIFCSPIKVSLHGFIKEFIQYIKETEDEWLEPNKIAGDEYLAFFNCFLQYALKQPDPCVKKIGDELLRLNTELSDSHPHYLRNSKAHRLKVRIAIVLLLLAEHYECSDMLWSALFSPSDYFKTSYIYERIVAKALRDPERLIERLRTFDTLGPNQQKSLLSVTDFFVRNKLNTLKSDELDTITGLVPVKSNILYIKEETIISPIRNIYPESDFESQTISNNNADLIVVAVLIDDMAMVNDLIQTCKALGVRTLILNDATNMSLNSDDTLNILKLKLNSLHKYLSQKKLENYKVIATRNTSQNEDFVGFTFEEFTILLLSHPKRGIPMNLKYMLDNIVQIPQNDCQYAQKLLVFQY